MASSDEEESTVVDDYVGRFDLQPGWIDLTLSKGTKAEAEDLARATVDRLNPLSLEIEKSAILDDMVSRAISLNEDAPIFAATYYSENGRGLADLVVDSYGDEGVARPTPEEVQPQLLEWGNAQAVGDPEVAYLTLPIGPAVRVQSMLKVKTRFGFGRKVTEFIKYAIFPPGIGSVIVATATWQLIQHAEELTKLTDELMPTFRLVPVDADGKEIGPVST